MLAVLLFAGIIGANMLKQSIGVLRRSLMPASVLGGMILLVASTVCEAITGTYLFDYPVFSAGSAFSGIGILETVTYHCLGIGFIAMTLRRSKKPRSAKRAGEIFDSGVMVVGGYLLQATVGVIVVALAVKYVPKLIEASGILLAFGYGQGTGQALNYGALYENQFGFEGGKSFGLALAAMGFLSASIVGVAYLNVLKRRGVLTHAADAERHVTSVNDFEEENEFPLTESVDKLTVQVGIILMIYAVAYFVMRLLGGLVGEGLRGTIYGFNFLIATLVAIVFNKLYGALRAKNVIKREYINNFMMNRIGGLAFDVMIIAGIGAIKLDVIKQYWGVLLILGVLGAALTFVYVKFVCDRLFPEYKHEQFLGFYGMLTGTASTGVILLREADPNFETGTAENIVFHTVPAIAFGFPLMFLASYAPQSRAAALITLGILALMFAVMLVILFRRSIFRKNGKAKA